MSTTPTFHQLDMSAARIHDGADPRRPRAPVRRPDRRRRAIRTRFNELSGRSITVFSVGFSGERKGAAVGYRVAARWMTPAPAALGLIVATAVATAPGGAAEPDTCDPRPGVENSCAGQPPETWPIAQGSFTSPDDPGWIYFKPFHLPAGFGGPKADAQRAVQYGCGIGPDGTIGCDHVPGNPFGNTDAYRCGELRCPLPPPGTNQTVAGPQQPAEYVYSEVLTFTRDGAGDLPEAHRLVNGDAWCAVGYQGSVSCVSGDNGFTLAWWGGVLEPWPGKP